MNGVVHYLPNLKLLILVGLITVPLVTWADTPVTPATVTPAAKTSDAKTTQAQEQKTDSKEKKAPVAEKKTPAATAKPIDAAPKATKTVAKPVAKPVVKPAADPAAQPATKTVAKPAAKPATDAVAKPAADPAVKPVVKAVAKPAAPARVRFETNMGHFVVELNAEKAPITVKNFLSYVDAGFYNNLIFHRVISNFMIQGGGFNVDMKKADTQAPIVLESKKGLSNLRGTIAMARTGNPNSATSQFFINVVNNRNLDSYGGGYAVFGKVIEGLENVDKIRTVPTGYKAGHRDVPVKPVIITSAKRL